MPYDWKGKDRQNIESKDRRYCVRNVNFGGLYRGTYSGDRRGTADACAHADQRTKVCVYGEMSTEDPRANERNRKRSKHDRQRPPPGAEELTERQLAAEKHD